MIAISSFNGHERRKFVRVHEPINVRFRIIGKSASRKARKIDFGDWIDAVSCDVGRGGMCLEFISPPRALIRSAINPKNMIEVEVHLPIHRRLMVSENVKYFRALGKVTWNKFTKKKKIWQAGLNFTKIGPDAEKLISNYIVERYIQKYGGE